MLILCFTKKNNSKIKMKFYLYYKNHMVHKNIPEQLYVSDNYIIKPNLIYINININKWITPAIQLRIQIKVVKVVIDSVNLHHTAFRWA